MKNVKSNRNNWAAAQGARIMEGEPLGYAILMENMSAGDSLRRRAPAQLLHTNSTLPAAPLYNHRRHFAHRRRFTVGVVLAAIGRIIFTDCRQSQVEVEQFVHVDLG